MFVSLLRSEDIELGSRLKSEVPDKVCHPVFYLTLRLAARDSADLNWPHRPQVRAKI